jgi:mannose-6-phosphate isomerase
MLSIQAHPTREQAREGCAREDAAQIPRSAPDRCYRDANHKPEAQVALTDFWLLYGFRPIGEIRQLLDERGAGSAVRAFVEGHAAEPERLRGLYTFLMGLSQPEVDALIGPLVQKASALAADGRLELSSPDYWVARAAREFPLPAGHYDRGILAIYLLNLVHLRPGEGTFIGPGVLHAYLSGVAVEIMASSDNVLRGGLTPKHVDVAELLRILRFDRASPRVTAGVAASAIEREYRTPAEEFDLAGLVLEGGQRLQRVARAAETLLVTGGAAHLRAGDDELTLPRGAIALVPAGLGYTLAGAPGATLFRASVPGL